MTALTLPIGVRLIQPPARPFLVLETKTTLILDWDIESEPADHNPELTESFNVESGCCTISCVQDAVTLLEAYAAQDRDQLWAVYETGKGVRAFRLDKDFPTDHVSRNALVLALDPDHQYMTHCHERRHWAARVSHKAGRPHEEIRFLQWVGTGSPMSQQWAVVRLHHELLLQQHLTQMPFDALEEALASHLNLPKTDSSGF